MRKFLTLALLVLLMACQSESQRLKSANHYTLLGLKSGEEVVTGIAITSAEQEIGLSGTKSEDFGDDKGLLFFYLEDGEKHFWMPDTYFDLDLFFLDKDFKVIDVIRKLPHYVGRASPEMIPRARGVWSRHVLEMKASSPTSQKIQVGDILSWKGEKSLPETEALVKKLQNNL